MRRTKLLKILSVMLVSALLITCVPQEYVLAAGAETDSTEENREVSDSSETSLSTQSVEETGLTVAETKNGTITLDDTAVNEKKLIGMARPEEGYDLATVRCIYWENGVEEEIYAQISEQNDGSYMFSIDNPPTEGTVTATFFSTTVWDGAVDISWYDPDQTEYEIGEPAQLAGLAAIVNGMVDENITSPDMIKGDADKYIQTVKVEDAELTSQQGGGTDDVIYRLPEVSKANALGGDDKYHDMRYRTIRITADIDMGELNFTPIGGKYAMDTTATSGDAKVIDTRFQGILDGQGHTINLNCDRYSEMGYAYSMDIGFIGYLGGGIGGGAKDIKVKYANEGWVPTVRNIVITGKMRGRRMVGGIVGRTGQTNYGTLVENCANYADVESTDMRGCSGIVGAAWGVTTIRNCYNAGTISAKYDEAGGIIGSNGYEKESADIYNCYNIGRVTVADKYFGREIGTDGVGGGSYSVTNCYYLAPKKGDVSSDEGYAKENNTLVEIEIEAKEESEMQSKEFCDILNTNGSVFVEDTTGMNGGYPILYFQEDSQSTLQECSVSLGAVSNGVVTVSQTGNIPYGTTIQFYSDSDKGYTLRRYTVNGKQILHDYYTVTEDIKIGAEFSEVSTVTIHFPESEDYEAKVTKIYDGSTQTDTNETVSDGDALNEGDVILVKGEVKEGALPGDTDLEYSGEFETPKIADSGAAAVDNKNNQKFTVTGSGDLEIQLVPKTQGKRWITVADTNWYNASQKTFTITTASQLAGMAKILYEGTDSFAGKTILLGNDIDLNNADGTDGMRNWSLAGTINHPFKGTFDGQNHTIRNMYRNYNDKYCPGSYGGLFAATESAVIQNVTIQGTFTKAVISSGAIAGVAKDSQIINCTAKVTMDTAKECGGIVGEAEGTTTIQQCKNEGDISGTSSLAGIAGKIEDAEGEGVQIGSCQNSGTITGTGYKIAGIAADCTTKGSVSKCVNAGNITASHNSSSSITNSVGGISGTVSGAMKISNCVNRGNIRAENRLCSAGGIVGYISNTSAAVISCYNTGNVYSEGKLSSNACAAGIANTSGLAKCRPAIRNCYSIGEITIGSGFATQNYGGCIGYGTEKNTNISNNYCLNTSVSAISGTAGMFGEVVTAAKLKTMASTLGTDYVRDTKNENQGYPILTWQQSGAGQNTGTDSSEQQDTSVASVTLSSVKSKSFSSIALGWTKNGTATGYEVYRATSKKGTYKLIKTISEEDTASMTDSGLICGKTYYYKVRAYRTISGVKYYGNYSSVNDATTVLGKTTISKLQNLKGRKAQLKWKKVSGASGYEVYRSMKKTKGYKKITTIKKCSIVTWKDQKLIKGKTYYYKIRAYRTVNGKKVYSSWSNIKMVRVNK